MLIVIYLQSESIEKYQVELCSKYDFDVILGQVVLCRKYSNDVGQQVETPGKATILSRDKFILLRDITLMLHWRLCYTMTGKQVDAAIKCVQRKLDIAGTAIEMYFLLF